MEELGAYRWEGPSVVEIGPVRIGNGAQIALIAGPCVIEGESSTIDVALMLKEIASRAAIPLIFKSSYDKANRTSICSFRGPGMVKGLQVLARVKEETKLPVITDIHETAEAGEVAKVVDAIQIPAFLCRQTDLLLAAGTTGKPINIKKGQFLAPWDVVHLAEKVASVGNRKVLITERGATFGYNNLVADMRSIPIMRGLGFPVIFDATHSAQLPGEAGKASSGQREFVPHLARAAIAAGCDAIFLEVHPRPDFAPCDGPNMLPIDDLPHLIQQIKAIDKIVRGPER